MKNINYDTYHKTLSGALHTVIYYVHAHGFKLIDPDFCCEAVSYGQTRHLHLEAEAPAKNAAGVKKGWFHAAIYRMESGTYELVVYRA